MREVATSCYLPLTQDRAKEPPPAFTRLKPLTIAWILSALFFSSLLSAQEPAIAPPGTSALGAAGEPASSRPTVSVAQSALPEEIESTLFDLYLGDSFQGGILSDYTEEWFEIQSPRDVFDQLKDLSKEADREALIPLLSGRIEKSRTVAGVGTVRVDIYKFRIVLDLQPSFLHSQALDLTRRVADPSAGLSFQQKVGLALTGTRGGNSEHSFSHRTILSNGRFVSRFTGWLSGDQSYQLTEASAAAYVKEYEVGGGYIETAGLPFASSLDLAGFRARTSADLLLDPQLGSASRLEIFVPSRARVEFYREGVLLAVQILDFGLQEINTSAFPAGSYDVDIIIIEVNGRQTRDSRFFTKSGYMAALGVPMFDLSIGVKRDEFDAQSEPLYQGNIRWRAADILELEAGGYGESGFSIASVGANALYRALSLRSNTSVSSAGDWGVGGHASASVFGFHLGTGVVKTIRNSDRSRAPEILPTPAPNEPPILIVPDRGVNELFFQDRSLRSLSIGRTFGSFDLSYQYQRERFAENQERRFSGPTVLARLFGNNRSNLNYRFSLLDTDQGRALGNTLNYTYRLLGNFAWALQLAANRTGSVDDFGIYSSLTYDERAGYQGNRYTWSEEWRRLSGEDSPASRTLASQLSGEFNQNYFNAAAFARIIDGNDFTESYGLTGQTGILLDEHGTVAVAGGTAQDAVLIATVSSNTTKSAFEVVLNGQKYATIRGGQRVAVGVAPFRTYKVGLRPSEEADLVDYSTETENITFFPGNVVSKTWNADRVFIVLGRLITPGGEPIRYQRIRGTREYSYTEADGGFQIEMNGSETLYLEGKGYDCKVQLKLDVFPEYFTDMGDTICQ